MSDIKDFIIEYGILVKYVGNDSSVTIPDSVVALGNFCFEDRGVEEVILSSTVESIFDAAFNETPNLQRIVVDSANAKYCSVDGCLYSKDKKRFIRSPNRTDTLHIAEGCEVIEPYAFFQRRVAGIVFPNTLKRFEYSALCNCHVDADELVIPDVEFRDGEWFNATTLPPIVRVEGVERLPDCAFAYSSFGCMRLPDTLTEIGGWAFGDCNMKRIYMPKSVTKIGEHAFAIERPAEPIRAGEYTEFMWYGDEEQDAECEADVAPIDNLLSCPVGFLLGVDNEECAAAQYAKENNIPYEVITDVDTFLNIR
jgi:hypothetical protein